MKIKVLELIDKLAQFSSDAEVVFEIDGEHADAPYIFPSMKGEENVNGEIETVEDLDCCIIKFA